MLKVFGHLSCENHVNDSLSKRSIFIPGERKTEAECQPGQNTDLEGARGENGMR